MPSPTPEELQEAKRRKSEERRIAAEEEQRIAEEKREQKRAEILDKKRRSYEFWLKKREALLPRIQRHDELQEKIKSIKIVENVLEGYYDEMDKLCKKAPADKVTELSLKKVNKVIEQVKDLLRGDDFIDSTEIFIPAGERPEHRDVILVLRELKQGIIRTEKEYEVLKSEYKDFNEYRNPIDPPNNVTEEEINNALNPSRDANRRGY